MEEAEEKEDAEKDENQHNLINENDISSVSKYRKNLF